MGVLQSFVHINAFFPLSTSLQGGKHAAEHQLMQKAQAAPQLRGQPMYKQKAPDFDWLNEQSLSSLKCFDQSFSSKLFQVTSS